MLYLCSGFLEAWQGVQGVGKRPPAGNARQRPDATLAHLGPAIPCRVASPQSPTPFHQAQVLSKRRGPAGTLEKRRPGERKRSGRLHRPFF